MKPSLCPPQGCVPPPSPTHRRSPIPHMLPRDEDDAVSETADSSLLIRMTPRQAGEEVLSVEVAPGEEERKTGKE